MLRSKGVTIGLLATLALLVPFLPYQGCMWGNGKSQPALLAPEKEQNNGELAMLVPKMTLVKKNIVDEDELKRELKLVHPVLPSGKQSRYQLYVTPNDSAVRELSAQTNGARDAYKAAVQWTWVSEQTLNHVPEKWLMPHEFLSNTPNYPSNPVKGKAVSDCEEQANTLVSLLRAEGIRPPEVRVVLGKVRFGDEEGGHAWVELVSNGHWLALEPTSGPHWDDEVGKLIPSRGAPFDYYASHTYPVVQVWAYFSDIYYLDPSDDSGNAPASWRKAAMAE